MAEPSTSGAAEVPPPRLAKPHRCNARLEDLIQALYTFEWGDKIRPSWRLFRQCLKSEPGQEPDAPYLVIKDPSKYLDPHKMHQTRPGWEGGSTQKQK